MTTKKRGAAHIEMVVSFGIFALFTFWLIVFLNPIRNQGISNVLLDGIERGIITNTSIDIIEIPVNAIPAGQCIKIKNPFNTTKTEEIFVKDFTGKTLKFKFPDTQNISIETSGDFYRIYYAKAQFNSPLLANEPCVALDNTQYNYTSARILSPLSVPRLNSLKFIYDRDYNSLKEEFDFPAISDFSVNITNLITKQSIIEMKRKKPKKVEVTAKEIPVELMQDDGTVIKAIMNVQVW